MTEQDYKKLGEECFNSMKDLNPNGGIREFVRIAAEFGYKRAVKKLTIHDVVERRELLIGFEAWKWGGVTATDKKSIEKAVLSSFNFKTMNREEGIQEIGKPYLIPLGFMQAFCLISFISTPFIWMWFDWSLAWKIGLSGLIGALIVWRIYEFVKSVINESIDQEMDKIRSEKPKTSKFQQKLEKAIEASRQAKAN